RTTAGYTFTAQLAKLAAPYREMLTPWPLAAVFGLGLTRLSLEVLGRSNAGQATLLIWLAMPAAILLTHSMWVLDYHLYSAYPPVILVAAYGTRTLVRGVAPGPLRHRTVDGRTRSALLAAAVAVLCWAQWRLAPPVPARAALEFGSARIVSDAAANIR